jgi:hypothetical protein
LSRGSERYTLDGRAVSTHPKRAQRHQELTVRAAPPVFGLSRGVFQHGFRQSMVKIDEERAMNEERFPPPGLSVAGDLSTADRNIGSSFRRPGETEGVENRADKVCP